MPTYEFKCNKCKHQFEVFTSISEKDETTCPKCKSRKITQLLSGFYTKGSSSSSCSNCSSSTCSSCSSKK